MKNAGVKRVIAWVLTLVMLVGMLPTTVLAEELDALRVSISSVDRGDVDDLHPYELLQVESVNSAGALVCKWTNQMEEGNLVVYNNADEVDGEVILPGENFSGEDYLWAMSDGGTGTVSLTVEDENGNTAETSCVIVAAEEPQTEEPEEEEPEEEVRIPMLAVAPAALTTVSITLTGSGFSGGGWFSSTPTSVRVVIDGVSYDKEVLTEGSYSRTYYVEVEVEAPEDKTVTVYTLGGMASGTGKIKSGAVTVSLSQKESAPTMPVGGVKLAILYGDDKFPTDVDSSNLDYVTFYEDYETGRDVIFHDIASGYLLESVCDAMIPGGTVNGAATWNYYNSNGVTQYFSQEFKDELAANYDKILEGVNTKMTSDEYEIVWYVIKYTAYDKAWHIDGLVREKNLYSVTYDGNGWDAGSPPTGLNNIEFEDEYTVLAASAEMKKTGHQLKSGAYWNTQADGGGESFAPGAKFKVTGNVTLYAQWEPAKYQINYNANGGSGAPAAQTKTYGVPLTLSTTMPVRAGHGFAGWNTKSNGSGTAYAPGASYPGEAAEGTTDVTLYAQWVENPGALVINKTVSGVDVAKLPDDFAITVVGEGYSRTLTPGNADVSAGAGYTYTWTLTGLPSGVYSVEEENYTIAGYTRTANPTSYTPRVPAGGSTSVELRNIYTADTYTVTYTDGMGGTIFADQVTTPCAYGEETPDAPIFTCDKFTFMGWSPAVADTVTGSVVYTAQWEPNYQIKHFWQRADGTFGDGAGEVDVETLHAPAGTSVTAAPESKTGYVFVDSSYTYNSSTVTTNRNGIVASDGTTVLNLYYVRTYTVEWENPHDPQWNEPAKTYQHGQTPICNTVPKRNSDSVNSYVFAGWRDETDTSEPPTLYNDTNPLPTVTKNVTYVAEFTPIPHTFTGTVKVVLNATFDDKTGEMKTGELVDADDLVSGMTENKLYASVDGTNFKELASTATGTYYSAALGVGTYHIYYKNNSSSMVQIGNQPLIIATDTGDRTIYLSFNSVTYDPNEDDNSDGGASAYTVYYPTGTKPITLAAAPVRTGYDFDGWWHDADGDGTQDSGEKIYADGSNLVDDEGIDHAYILRAKWTKLINVTVNVVVDHEGKETTPDGDTAHKDLVHLELLSGTPLLETGREVDLAHGGSGFTVETVPSAPGTAKEAITKTTYWKTFEAVRYDTNFSVTVNKENYELGTIEKETDANGNVTLTVPLAFKPDNENIPFSVSMATGTPQNLYPTAVIAKIAYWDKTSRSWKIIAQHQGTNAGVRLNIPAGGSVSETYPVYKGDGSSNPYYYRLVISAYVFGDQIIRTTEYTNGTYGSAAFKQGNYTATIAIPGSVTQPTDYGAYWNGSAWAGNSLEATVSVDSGTVTFDPNDGTFTADSTTAPKSVATLFTIPAFAPYAVTKSGNIFEGWYVDADGNGTIDDRDYRAVEGATISGNVTLIAKWRVPLGSIEGKVTVPAYYGTNGESTIQETTRATRVRVLLQHAATATSHFETVAETTVPLSYTTGAKPVGTGEYTFDLAALTLPETGRYRINVLVSNYTTTYQNEPDSTVSAYVGDPTKYNETDFFAEKGDDAKAVVNAYMVFTPDPYNMTYQVDATDIGGNFRPTAAQILIEYKYTELGGDYKVVSQMVTGPTTYNPQNVVIPGGNEPVNASYSVWKRAPNGYVSNYRPKLYSYTKYTDPANPTATETVNFADNPYFGVTYLNWPAYYDVSAGKQIGLPVVRLTAKTYDIEYDLDGGSWPDGYTAPVKHKWSHDTVIGKVPVKAGSVFVGWQVDAGTFVEDSGAKTGKIPAATIAKTQLKALWKTDANGDGTPDEEQVFIRYVAEGYGTVQVAGETAGISALVALDYNSTSVTADEDVTATAGTNNVLDRWTHSHGSAAAITYGAGGSSVIDKITITSPARGATYTFIASFAGDTKGGASDPEHTGDGVPDKYQKKVVFQVENGTWDGGTDDADKIYYINLYNSVGEYSATGTADITNFNKTGNSIIPDVSRAAPNVDVLTTAAWFPDPEVEAQVKNSTGEAVYVYAFPYVNVTYKAYDANPENDLQTVKTDDILYGSSITIDADGGTYSGPLGTGKHPLITCVELTDPVRDGFVFRGWEYTTDADPRDGDAGTFKAKWINKLDLHYDATVKTYLDNALKDSADIHGYTTQLYLTKDGVDFIELTKTGVGIYTADVKVGTYQFAHTEEDGTHKHIVAGYTLTVQVDGANEMPIHHYSVKYDTDGGSAVSGSNYFRGFAVAATDQVPTKAGHRFLHWSDGTRTYKAGDTVTDNITAPIVLTAVWDKLVNLKVNVTVNHNDDNAATKDDVTMQLVEVLTGPVYNPTGKSLSITPGSHTGYTYAGGTNQSIYTATAATFTELSDSSVYTVTVDKAGYTVSRVDGTTESDGTRVVNVTLTYDPEGFELGFDVRMNTSAPKALWPKAVNVKISYWGYNSSHELGWHVIEQQLGAVPPISVAVDQSTGTGSGNYTVWKDWSGTGHAYEYRVQVTGFVYGTGDTKAAVRNGEVYTDGNFVATVDVKTGGRVPAYPTGSQTTLPGAYHTDSGQNGRPTVTVEIEAYDVVFDANGGQFSDHATTKMAENQYVVPALSGYVPTRTDYIFRGWQYQNGTAVAAGDILTGNVTLYAKWEPVRELSGTILVDGTYPIGGETAVIHKEDRPKTVQVVLQEVIGSSVVNVGSPVTVNVDWGTGGSGVTGVANYLFEELDAKKTYRIAVSTTNYTAGYRNSTTTGTDYNAADYTAVFASDDAVSTFVNAKMTFAPISYTQTVKVDATAIGSGSRPARAKARIVYWEAPAYGNPATISQHLVDPYGLPITLTSGEGTASQSVWNLKWNNKVYQYQAKLTEVEGAAYDSTNPYYTVTYGPIRSYQDAAGTPLTITLEPKSYDITFVMNASGLANVTQTDKHKWSHETTVSIADPVRENYVFMGWYDNPSLTGTPVTHIAANVHKDVTLYAKWELDLMVNNTEVGGDLNGSARGDGVPDIYQARVTFDVVNGTWENGSKGTLERIYTLKGKDTNDLWTVDKAPKLGTLPAALPDATHSASEGDWDEDIDANTPVPAEGARYVYTYHKANEYILSVTVENGTAIMDSVRYTNTTATKLVPAVPVGATTKVEFEPALRHMLESVTVDGVSEDLDSNRYYTLDHTKSHVIHVVYTKDAVGKNGVPDKYEKRIVFKVEGGTWNGPGGATEIEEYVTLTDGGGNWSLSGTASLSGIIPNTAAAAAAPGYKAGTGKWVGTEPTAATVVSGTDTVTYTYVFSEPQYVDYSYTERHFRQLPNGSYAEADVEVVTILHRELNAAGNAFEEALADVTISLKDYGPHFVVDDSHTGAVLSGTPEYGVALTLKRYYALGEHTLQYMNGTNPVGAAVKERCGTDLEVMAGPVVSGLVFTGWKDEDSGTIYLPGDSLILDHNVTLYAQWTNAPVNYTVKYAEEGTGLPLGERTFVGEVSQVITDISYPATLTHAGTAYAYAYTTGLPLTLSVTAADNVVTVYYDTDAQNDGVADMYQKKVTFRVVNGKWSNGTTADIVQYLALKDGSGNYSESGSAALVPPVGMTANGGYAGGKWNVPALPGTVSGTEDVTYTFTFAKESGGGNDGESGGGTGNEGGNETGGSDKLNTVDHFSYIVGFQDGRLKPYDSITRGQVATIFFRLLTDEARAKYWSQTNRYSDCDEDLWCNNAISTLSNMGVIDGYQDGTFRPNAPITRAQFAKIAVGFFETTTKEYEGRYTDVEKSAWYSEYVEAASRVGLIQGFEDGTYRPNVNITRAQACVIVNRALGRKPDAAYMLPEEEMLVWRDNTPNDWFYADMLEATNSHDYTWIQVGNERVERWTEKLPQRDWTALEHSWSTAHSAPGGNVATGE